MGRASAGWGHLCRGGAGLEEGTTTVRPETPARTSGEPQRSAGGQSGFREVPSRTTGPDTVLSVSGSEGLTAQSWGLCEVQGEPVL